MDHVHNLKHKELYEWYNQQDNPKCKWTVFASRVVRYWYTKEDAINPKKLDRGKLGSDLRHKQYKSIVDSNGRVCRKCWEYKTFDKFHRTKASYSWYTSCCKECRNKQKAEYRARTWYAKDHEYKKKTRTLNVWEYIALDKPTMKDGILRENTFRIIDYKYKKWYTMESCLDWHIEKIDTWDNKNKKRFYRIDKPIELTKELDLYGDAMSPSGY